MNSPSPLHSPIASPEVESASPLVPDPTIPGRSSRHYPALDGLRGIAILMVMLFHGTLISHIDSKVVQRLFMIPLAGWAGVDVFFVLSGFLITGILIDSHDSPRHFRNFYARRVLRIFPVYYLFLAFMLLVLPHLKAFDTPGLQDILRYQGWLWTHLTNFGFIAHHKAWALSDWLDLNHLWSLAVEEQFYLVWPITVYFLSRRRLKVVCLACFAGSLLIRTTLWLMHQKNGAIYFPTFCRLDGLALGSLAAVLIREQTGAAISRLARRLGVVSLVAVLAIALWRGGWRFTDSPTVVFGVAAASLLATAILLNAMDSSTRTASLLSNRVLGTVGKYSYGLYLFHAPICSMLQLVASPEKLEPMLHSQLAAWMVFILLYLAIVFTVAVASWHGYERHWLKLKPLFDYRPAPVQVAAGQTTNP